MPLSLPYLTSWSDYERFDGEITINGSHHNYVKRKIASDTLYLLCIPNKEKDELDIAKTSFGTDANDLAGKSDQPQAKKTIGFSHYQVQDVDYSIACAIESPSKAYPFITASLTDSFIDKHGRPPRS